MSSNVGLTTPRGSGTSGYVQRNLSHLKPRDNFAPYPSDAASIQRHKQRKPDKDILNHDRLRQIEVKVLELQDRLEEEGVEEEEVEVQTEALRRRLNHGGGTAKDPTHNREAKSEGQRTQFKNHQVHEMAAAKIQESEKLRKALGIRSDYEEGSHWRRAEERLKDGVRGEAISEKREKDGR